MRPRFMTGVYGSFQPARIAKETRPGFAGIEASHLSSLEEAEALANYVREQQWVLGVHFPLVKDFHAGNGILFCRTCILAPAGGITLPICERFPA